MGEWDRLRSEFVRGECFDFLQPARLRPETTDALETFIAEHDLDDLRRRIR
jgi:hypothetical protein